MEINKVKSSNLLEYEDVMIVNSDGIIVFDDLANLSLFDLKPENVIGKKVTSLYGNLNEENSTLMSVLRDGKPILDYKQELITKGNNIVYQIGSTYPIVDQNGVVGAIEFSKYLYTKDSLHYVKKHSHHKIIRKNNTIYTIDDIIGENDQIIKIKERIKKVARNDSSVLINGRTGTGKELIAQAIHNLSDRCTKPFISQNCAAIPSALLEGILFGTVKGSFTGAENRIGVFEQAQGGTIFLDEINSMDINTQVKILKVIEEKSMRRVGGLDNISLDVRVISAINEDPMQAIARGNLREDLFYRLSIVQINLPTLNERKDDIKHLIDYYLNYYNGVMTNKIKEIDQAVIDAFSRYGWPGNIRELRYAIEAMYSGESNNGKIGINDVDGRFFDGQTAEQQPETIYNRDFGSLKKQIEDYEWKIISNELELTNGNISEAARRFKISKQALLYKISKHQEG